jgi:hypothetical protein
MVDSYTKSMLTVIAMALVWLCIAGPPQRMLAQNDTEEIVKLMKAVLVRTEPLSKSASGEIGVRVVTVRPAKDIK